MLKCLTFRVRSNDYKGTNMSLCARWSVGKNVGKAKDLKLFS